MTENVYRRKIYDKFLEWKNRAKGTTALLIEGARRVGKSTVVAEFGRREYRSFVLIDFRILSVCVNPKSGFVFAQATANMV